MAEDSREVRVCVDGVRIERRRVGDAGVDTVYGHAAVFNTLSEDLGGFREKIKKGAFKRSLADGADVRALIEHTGGLAMIGRSTSDPATLRMKEDLVGLAVEIDLPDTTAGHDVSVLIDRGDLSQMSFGFRTVQDAWTTEGGEQVRTVSDVDLFDVSVVAYPAYPDTDVALRSLEEATSEGAATLKAQTDSVARDQQLREFDLTEAERCCKL